MQYFIFSLVRIDSFLGITNHIVRELQKCWTDEEKWEKECNFSRTGQHGGVFNGNTCKAILGPSSTLVLEGMIPLELLGYVVVLKSLNRVVESCFGFDLHPEFQAHIKLFGLAFSALEISITPKVFYRPNFVFI